LSILDQALPYLLTAVTKSWERFRLQILKLPLEQQIALYDWLTEAIAQQQQPIEDADIPVQSGREVVESRASGKVTYRLEMVKCGKLACRCASGLLHGPYWYAYHKHSGRLKSRYVGKELPAPE
jgi:hypothetical protein